MGFDAGFARAINLGIRETSGEFVMFCNADLFPTSAYIPEMVRFFARRPRAGAAIGKILRFELETERQTDLIDTAGLALDRQRRFMPRGEGERDVGQFDEELEVFAVDGAGMVARRSASRPSASRASTWTRTSSRTRKTTTSLGGFASPAGSAGTCPAQSRTTPDDPRPRLVGYLSALMAFHRNEREKSTLVRINAMKNQWLMLMKNEDRSNLARDFRSSSGGSPWSSRTGSSSRRAHSAPFR